MLNTLRSTDHERWSRFAALGVCAFAAGVGLYLLVRIAWLLVPHGSDAQQAVPGPGAAPPSASTSVAKWHLFGNPQALPSTSASPSLATVLKLGLRGTLALPDPRDERAIAIIANEQGIETSFRIGADVAAGAKLAEVYADHVVLDHQGVAETLTLPRPEQHAPPAQGAGTPRATATVPSGIVTGQPPAAATPGSAPSATTAGRVDPQEFARQIRPVFADGRIIGADISGADSALLARVGLKPTDVVTAINGTALSTVSNPQALIDQLRNSQSIQVTVQRDGKPATLTLSLR